MRVPGIVMDLQNVAHGWWLVLLVQTLVIPRDHDLNA